MAYDRLPQYGRDAGFPSDVWEAELARYAPDEESPGLSRDDRVRTAHERREEEYARRKNEGTVRRNGGVMDKKNPYRGVLRANADMLKDADKTMWYMASLWRSHLMGFVMSAGLALAMFVHFGVWHWSQHHKAGRFPLETNFLHGVPPVNDDRDIDNVPFFWPLVFIPILCAVYHGMLLRAQAFAVYFYDNVLHHMGSAKYLAYSPAYALVALVVLVLVGAVDLLFILTFAVCGGAMYMIMWGMDWQRGRIIKNHAAGRISGEKFVIDTFVAAAGQPAMTPMAGDRANDVLANVSDELKEFVDVTATATKDTIQASDAILAILSKFPEHVIYASLAAVQDALSPVELVLAPYVHAAIVQLWLHIVVLVYYIEANQNSGWHELPWIAHFAFFMFFLPTIIQLVAYALYFLEVGPFAIFAAHEIMLVISHTTFLCVFAGVIYFFSNQYGTLYV